jgi:pyruvate dehydrogenase E2 component (dihydrolipoamide acetyltransferase)
VPVAIEDQVVVRPMLTLTATFDHRYVDGFHAAQFAEAVRSYCDAPSRLEPALPGAVTAPDVPG